MSIIESVENIPKYLLYWINSTSDSTTCALVMRLFSELIIMVHIYIHNVKVNGLSDITSACINDIVKSIFSYNSKTVHALRQQKVLKHTDAVLLRGIICELANNIGWSNLPNSFHDPSFPITLSHCLANDNWSNHNLDSKQQKYELLLYFLKFLFKISQIRNPTIISTEDNDQLSHKIIDNKTNKKESLEKANLLNQSSVVSIQSNYSTKSNEKNKSPKRIRFNTKNKSKSIINNQRHNICKEPLLNKDNMAIQSQDDLYRYQYIRSSFSNNKESVLQEAILSNQSTLPRFPTVSKKRILKLQSWVQDTLGVQITSNLSSKILDNSNIKELITNNWTNGILLSEILSTLPNCDKNCIKQVVSYDTFNRQMSRQKLFLNGTETVVKSKAQVKLLTSSVNRTIYIYKQSYKHTYNNY